MSPKLILSLTLVLTAGFSHYSPAATARDTLLASAQAERRKSAEHPYPFRDVKVFDVASSNTVAGAGFLVAAGGRILAITAKHPFAEAEPTDLIGETNQFRLKEKTHDADDVLAYTVEATNVPAFHLMPEKSRLLRAGDTLSLVGHDGVLTGKLMSAELGQDGVLLPGQTVDRPLQLVIPGVHQLAGNSGAPIILDETGEVLGVLLAAGEAEWRHETAAGFQLLTLDPSERHAAFAPQSIFSIKTSKPPTARLADISAAILPPELFTLTPGMPITKILEQRPFLANTPTPWLRGSNYGEKFSSDYLFHSMTFTVVGGQTVEFSLMNGAPNPTAGQVESLFDWFFATLGKPAEAFSFGEHRNQPGHASVYCQWANSQATVILGASRSNSQHIYLELLAYESGTTRSKILQPSWMTTISSDLEFLHGEVQKLASQAGTQKALNPN